MSVLAPLLTRDEFLSTLVATARTKNTDYLRDTYRQGLELDPPPWDDVMDAVRIVLRERIAADWLHAVWCPVICCPLPVEHLASVADGAREVVVAFDAGRGVAEAVYRAMTPDGAAPALGTAELSRTPSFQQLLADLVSVVPSEVTR